jgi:hypothetical protein
VEAHGGLHHAVHFQPAMTGIFQAPKRGVRVWR